MSAVSLSRVFSVAELHFAAEQLIRLPPRARRRHEPALADQRIRQQHDRRKNEQIVQRTAPTADRRRAAAVHTLPPERLGAIGTAATRATGSLVWLASIREHPLYNGFRSEAAAESRGATRHSR